MSSVLVVTPLVVAGWPILAAAISAAVGTMGFAVSQQNVGVRRRQILDANATNRAEIEVEDSEILAGTSGTGEEMVVERDGIRAVFSRDARGALKLCLEGHGLSKSELRRLGEELVGRVTQQYAYHRVISELKERQLNILDERVGEDQTITIRVRNG
jgi:hypothetical protein